MSSVGQDLRAYADLFTRWYDELHRAAVRTHGAGWLADPALDSRSKLFMADVEQGRPVGAIEMRLNSGSRQDRDRDLFAALLGLDLAFRHVHPLAVAGGPGAERTLDALLELQARVAATGRLDSGRHGGALLPRLVEPARTHGEPDDKRDLFHYVLRVPDDSWQRCDVLRMNETQLLHPTDVAAGVTVACVPVIAEPAELNFLVGSTGYRIAPAGADATLDRIGEIVTALDRSSALIGMAPELTLTPELLERWQAALARRRRTRLRWVLAGSGPIVEQRGRPTNTAVLLDARTGEVIGTQGKQYAFDFTAEELARWGLESRLGTEPITEDIARANRLTVFDAGSQRVCILICEDLGRVVDLGPVVRDLGVSLILVPVFGRPIQEQHWEQQAANVHVRTIGATVVVANSLVVHEITGKNGATAIVVPAAGKVKLDRADGPADVVCFRLDPDGSADHA
jgi:predicted amidohydrolase